MAKCSLCDEEVATVCEFCDKGFCSQHWKRHAHAVPTGEEINFTSEEDKQQQLAAITEKHRREAEESRLRGLKTREQLRREDAAIEEQIEEEDLDEALKRDADACPVCGGSGRIPAPFPMMLMLCWECGGSGRRK